MREQRQITGLKRMLINDFSCLSEKAQVFAKAAITATGKDILTIQEACEFLGISRATAIRHYKKGALPLYKMLGEYRINILDAARIKAGEKITIQHNENTTSVKKVTTLKQHKKTVYKTKSTPRELMATLKAM